MSNSFNSIIWQPEDFILFRKCGEISVSPDAQYLSFNCGFCTSTCLKADVFLHHLQDQHKDDVFKMYQVKSPTHNGEQLQLHEFYIFNDNEINVDWVSVDDIPSVTLINSEKLQGDAKETGKESEAITPTSALNDLDGIGNSIVVYPNQNMRAKTQVESLFEINPLEYTCAPAISPSNSSYSSSDFESPESTNYAINREMDDTKESARVVQIPCPNLIGDEGEGLTSGVCSGLSDCLSHNEDSSSKSFDTSADSWNSATGKEESYQHLRDDAKRYSELKNLNGKYIKTADMRKALCNKEVITCLLQLYRENEKFWNPQHAAYKYNAPRTVYNELTRPLLQKTNITFSGVEIFGILNILRGRYRRELTKFQTRNGKHRTRLWYFHDMDFLRKIVEGKRRARLSERSVFSSIKKPNTENVTNRQVLSFIVGQYKYHECLWNPKDPKYNTCNKTKLYDELATRLHKERNVRMNQNEVENEIQKLRVRFRKELRLLHKLKGLYIPKLWCFDELEFLRPVMEDQIIKNIKTNSCHLLPRIKKSRSFLNVKEIPFSSLEEQLWFVDLYRKYASLWDVDHPDFRSAYYRNIALHSMLDEVHETMQPLKPGLEQLEKTLNQMRKQFSMEKRKRITGKDHIDRNLPSVSRKMSLVVYEKLSTFLAMNLGPFRCENCYQLCKTYDQYKIHTSKHDGALPFICTLCGKGFQMPGNLAIHIRRHRHDFPYSCQTCQKSFATSTEVTIHMRSHTGERPYICDLCSKTFKTWSFFDIHKRTHLNKSNFHCPICDKSFYERNRFTDHMNVHLNIRKHQCEHCGKGYTTISNLKKHQELHASTMKYKCTMCGQSFAQFASLKWHKKTQHELPRP